MFTETKLTNVHIVFFISSKSSEIYSAKMILRPYNKQTFSSNEKKKLV